MSDAHPFRLREFGEVVLRVRDLDRVEAFYRDVLGFRLLRRWPDEGFSFLTIGEGYGGHATVLGLFEERLGSTREGHGWDGWEPKSTTLHHFAVTIGLEDYEAAADHLEARGVAFNRREFAWVGWRSLFMEDPEGNVVELVAYDASVLDEEA